MATLRQLVKACSIKGGAPPKQRLLQLVDAISVTELGLDKTPLSSTSISFIPVFASPEIEINMFGIPRGLCLPTHDHPHMTVVSRVVQGSLLFTLFNPKGQVFTRTTTMLTDTDPSVLAEPHANNVHLIESKHDIAVLLDVFLPPYSPEDGRDCNYYKETPDTSDPALVHLSPTFPVDFSTVDVPYCGESVSCQ